MGFYLYRKSLVRSLRIVYLVSGSIGISNTLGVGWFCVGVAGVNSTSISLSV